MDVGRMKKNLILKPIRSIKSGYAYKVICFYDDRFTKPLQIYRGKNAAYNFLEDILKEEKWCQKMKRTH